MHLDLGVALGRTIAGQDPNAAGGILDFVQRLLDQGGDRHDFALDDDGGAFDAGAKVANFGGRRWIQAGKDFGGIVVAGGGSGAEGEGQKD